MKQKFVWAACCLLGVFSLLSCTKYNYEVLTNFQVRLSSSGYNVDEINIEVKQVKVNFEDTTWVDMQAPQQVYNVLAYETNADTLIATKNLPATSVVKQIKIIIGQNNNVRVNGKTFQLVSTGKMTEIILPVNKKLNRSVEVVGLKFNPTLSISQNAGGGYLLSPVATLK